MVFIPPLKFHLIYFVTEQSKRELSVTVPRIPQVKSRTWEVLEILIPILSPSSLFLYWWLAELTLLRRNI